MYFLLKMSPVARLDVNTIWQNIDDYTYMSVIGAKRAIKTVLKWILKWAIGKLLIINNDHLYSYCIYFLIVSLSSVADPGEVLPLFGFDYAVSRQSHKSMVF